MQEAIKSPFREYVLESSGDNRVCQKCIRYQRG